MVPCAQKEGSPPIGASEVPTTKRRVLSLEMAGAPGGIGMHIGGPASYAYGFDRAKKKTRLSIYIWF